MPAACRLHVQRHLSRRSVLRPDITEPPFVLGADRTLNLPEGPGIGLEVQRNCLAEAKARWREYNPSAPLF